jgi:hypothetical protein
VKSPSLSGRRLCSIFRNARLERKVSFSFIFLFLSAAQTAKSVGFASQALATLRIQFSRLFVLSDFCFAARLKPLTA